MKNKYKIKLSYPKWFSWFAYPLIILGRILQIVAVLSGVVPILDKGKSGFSLIIICGVISFVVFVSGAFIVKAGRRLLAVKMGHKLTENTDPEVVYLRSFLDDSETSKALSLGHGTNIGNFIHIPSFNITTLENELFETLLGTFNSIVAVGKPGEKLPKLGVPRIYLPNSDWQSRVEELMLKAKLVILRLGKTKGIKTELKMAIDVVKPERLLFLIPCFDTYDQYLDFKKELKGILKVELPSLYGLKTKKSLLAGLLYFEPDHTAFCFY